MGPSLEGAGNLIVCVNLMFATGMMNSSRAASERSPHPSRTLREADRKLKVLVLDPSGSSVHVTHNLCNHLAELGCDVQVFTAPHWLRAMARCPASAYRTHIVFYRGTQFRSYETRALVSGRFWRLLRLAQHARTLVKLCALSRDFDVVHTQILPVPLLDYLCLWLISRHTPVVCTVHELVPHNSRFRRITGILFKAIYHRASLLFVYTDFTRNRLIQLLGIAPEKIVNVPHGNIEHMLALVPPRNVEDQRPLILFIGSVRLDKGLDTLIRAASQLRRRMVDFKVLIAGAPGFDVAALRDSVAALGIQHQVEFRFGYMPEEKFVEHLCRATVVALPYKRVEQSGVAIAACTLGKAIVATRCGGVEELITEAGNGVLVPVDDAGALADALEEVLLDESKRRQFELRSRQYAAEALSWGPIAEKTLAGYRTAIERRLEFDGKAVCASRPASIPSAVKTGADSAEWK